MQATKVTGRKADRFFTGIPNDVMEALSRWPLTPSARQLLLVLCRETNGWHRDRCALSLKCLAGKTGLSKATVCRAAAALEAQNIIFRRQASGKTTEYRINGDVSTWRRKGCLKNETPTCLSGETPTCLSDETPTCLSGETPLSPQTPAEHGPDKSLKKSIKEKKTPYSPPKGDGCSNLDDKGHDISGGDFERFWEAYPRHTQRAVAERRWNTLKPSSELVEKILKAIRAQISSGMFNLAEPKYIPHPATWLNQRRWNDEVGFGRGKAAKPRQIHCDKCHLWHLENENCPR